MERGDEASSGEERAGEDRRAVGRRERSVPAAFEALDDDVGGGEADVGGEMLAEDFGDGQADEFGVSTYPGAVAAR